MSEVECSKRRWPGHETLEEISIAKLAVLSTALSFAAVMTPLPEHAEAARGRLPPINNSNPARCSVAALDSFADTRAKFSQEASGGNMVEAIVDVRGCDFSNMDLSGKVFSGVFLQGATLENSKVVGSQFARADAKGANMVNVDFTDANCYASKFDGADLRGAQFENSILTAATFGKDSTGKWADLTGAHFEGSLVSSSDIARICENPTLEEYTKRSELGCRTTSVK
eukprot:jgi/Chrzof1/3303/Cz12g20070.t1